MRLEFSISGSGIKARDVLWRDELPLIPRFDPVNDAHISSHSKAAAYNIPILLTNSDNKGYPTHITAKSVIRLGILEEAAIGRKVLCNAAFLLSQCAHNLWAGWAGAARPPVRFTGIPTCSVPPTRLESGSGSYNELEHIS